MSSAKQCPQRTNLYREKEGEYIYYTAKRRYAAYKRYPENPDKPWDKKYFNKGGLFYTYEDARLWLESLPEIMERPRRYAPSEDTGPN